MPKEPTEAATRQEQAFAYYAELPAEERRYAFVAQHFGISLATVKLWASRDRWRRQVAERDARVVRRAVDKAESAEVDTRARYLKIVELALIKLANGIASGEVRGSFSDVDRLIRLKVFLEEPDMPTGGPQQVLVNIVRTSDPAAGAIPVEPITEPNDG